MAPTLAEMEELRQDMLLENWCDEQCEIKMRNDDDFFYDAIVDKFESSIRELEIEIDNYCTMYDREDQTDRWFRLFMEK